MKIDLVCVSCILLVFLVSVVYACCSSVLGWVSMLSGMCCSDLSPVFFYGSLGINGLIEF